MFKENKIATFLDVILFQKLKTAINSVFTRKIYERNAQKSKLCCFGSFYDAPWISKKDN